MPVFRYTALAADGATIQGDMDAADRTAAIQRLQDQGLLPIEAVEARADPARPQAPARRPPTTKTLVGFSRQLATLLSAGIPLERSLAIQREMSAERATVALVARLHGRITGGEPFSAAAAAEDFDPVYVAMLGAGEAGGTLDRVVERLAESLERGEALREGVRSALIYPAIVLAVAALSIAVLLGFVLPRFAALFQGFGRPLPPATQMMLALGDVVAVWGPPLAVLAVLAAVMGPSLLKRPERRLAFDTALLRLPLFGDLIARFATERVMRLLGTLVANGVALPAALEIVANAAGNAAIGRTLREAASGTREGRRLSAMLAAGKHLPAIAIELTRVGEESGRLDAMLLKTAEILDRETQRATARLVALLTPALTILLGGIVALIVLSLISAVMDIYELAI
ncbi:MAG: type II secretion system F family protein [Alphaproteobacteria bacterium]|nr:type II secretion system F family protein [Alphaproteobacteria bacterium]